MHQAISHVVLHCNLEKMASNVSNHSHGRRYSAFAGITTAHSHGETPDTQPAPTASTLPLAPDETSAPTEHLFAYSSTQEDEGKLTSTFSHFCSPPQKPRRWLLRTRRVALHLIATTHNSSGISISMDERCPLPSCDSTFRQPIHHMGGFSELAPAHAEPSRYRLLPEDS